MSKLDKFLSKDLIGFVLVLVIFAGLILGWAVFLFKSEPEPVSFHDEANIEGQIGF